MVYGIDVDQTPVSFETESMEAIAAPDEPFKHKVRLEMTPLDDEGFSRSTCR